MITLGITKILVKRLKSRTKISARSGATNIALIPAIQGVPLRDFARRLYVAFSGMDSVILLNSHNINKEFSTEDIAQTTEDDPRNIGFKAWLEELEASHSIVLYEADMEVSPWTQRCISQADQVLLVAMAEDDADQRELEKECFRESRSITAAKKVLILIHRDDIDMPFGTKKWLNGRQLTGYHHLRWGRDSDFHRLVRILSGRSIGLVLGGGGAKGMAHIGVLRALDEMGIPIDFIGGTSMGAVVAGAYAMGMKYKRMIQLSKLLFHKVSPFGEFTIPIISLMRSRKLDQIAKIAFEDTQIEDLWLNYFCVSTNLTSSNLKVHMDGALSKAVRTSGSIPGIAVPIICDGEIYVDRSVLNNLPGDIMRQQAGIVIIVDVSPAENVSATIEQFPSPWKILWSRLLPWKKPIKAPNILDILFSTMSAGSKKSGNAVKEDADLCLSPSLEDFGFVDFKNLEGAAQIGYEYTKAVTNNLNDDDLKRRLTVLKPKEKNILHS